MAGIADPEANLDVLIDNLMNSIVSVVNNLYPVIQRVANNLMARMPQIFAKLGNIIQ